MIITISGLPGAGKTTTGKYLAKKLGYKFYSMGDLRGKMATDRGMTIDQLNDVGKEHEWTDKEVDDYQKKLAQDEDNFIIDGWISYHFIPQSLKVLLIADEDTCARRVFNDQRPDEDRKESVQEIKAMLKKRLVETDARYKKYYGINNFHDPANFDLVIDSKKHSIEESSKIIMNAMKKHK